MPFRLSNLALRTSVWNTAIHSEAADFQIGDALSEPVRLFDSRRIFRRRDDVLHRADPFLFARGDALYIFLEAQTDGGRGRIEGWQTTDLNTFSFIGDVLAEPFHLSYPFVFEDGGAVFMIPESSLGGGLFLYEFLDFPARLVRRRTLLEGPFVDSNLIRWNGRWYLFTESPKGLQIFHTDDFRTGAFVPHPLNPITRDRRYSRCGGGAIEHGGRLLRLAQDCSTTYGSNLHVLAIDELSPDSYSESVLQHDLFDRSKPWNMLGAHHLSIASFKGRTAIAADGLRHDYYIHRLRDLAAKGLKSTLGTLGLGRS
jgi:hypothetical protein